MADRLPPGQGALQNWNNINLNKPEEYSSEFTIGGNKFANVTNVSTGQRQLFFVQPVSNQRGLLTTTNADGNIDPGDKYNNFNQFNPGKLAAAEAASKQASVKLLSTPGISTPAEAAAIKNSKEFKSTSVGNNAATSSPAPDGQTTPPPTSEESAAAAKEASSFKKGTRRGEGSYATNMKYPINLQSEVQDVIRFSILEYSPSLAKGNRSESGLGSEKSRVVTLEGNNPIIKGSTRIGMITLPIPAGISDSNTAGWQPGEANALTTELTKGVDTLFSGGTPEQAGQVAGAGGEAVLKSGDLSAAVRGMFLNSALQTGGAMQRTQGAVFNNNLELLFSGPGLRQFSFAFLFYPREPKEAKMVRQIIRAFKQAMSVKRSATSLLLKAPHTFAIQYMTSIEGKTVAHPYLNRFKECALTSCSVDYTPDGTYMTYDSRGNPDGDEKSMTAYRLGLTFQELEPLFDDEYNEIDGNKDLEIGF
jgi:hypothetical protein